MLRALFKLLRSSQARFSLFLAMRAEGCLFNCIRFFLSLTNLKTFSNCIKSPRPQASVPPLAHPESFPEGTILCGPLDILLCLHVQLDAYLEKNSVCVCTCVPAPMCLFACVHTCICVCRHVCTCVCVCLPACVCIPVLCLHV